MIALAKIFWNYLGNAGLPGWGVNQSCVSGTNKMSDILTTETPFLMDRSVLK
jgi:hypothetical protein